MKKFPWISLGLLFLTYSIFGWLLSVWSSSWQIWLIAVALILLILLAVTEPVRLLTIFSLKSDVKAFFVLITITFVVVLILRWLPIFAHIFVLISAAMLARLDLQFTRFSRVKVFLVLAVVSLTGMFLGLLINRLLMAY